MKLSVNMIILMFSINVFSVETLDCPYGTTPVLDGNIGLDEYTDAIYIKDYFSGSSMYVKHNGEAIFFAFDSVNSSYDIEHFFDTENDDASTPQTDDKHYGFHPYWTYEEQGNGSYFEPVEVGGWSFQYMWISQGLWRGEVSYPFEELGIENCDTIGMALFSGFNWSFDGWEPYNWGDLYSSDNWVGIPEKKNEIKFLIFQNPFYEILEIYIEGEKEKNNPLTLQIYNLTGSKLTEKKFNIIPDKIIWKGDDKNGNSLPAGNYFAILRYGDIIEKYLLTKLKK